MWRDIWSHLRALWKHWVVLVSGIGSVIVGAIGAYRKTNLPYWTFWVLALACFFIASFRAWRDERIVVRAVQDELQQLRVPKYSSERIQLARGQYSKLSASDKELLKEMRVRGVMLESQATESYRQRGVLPARGILHGIAFETSLVCLVSVDQYRINPEMEAALDRIFDEEKQST